MKYLSRIKKFLKSKVAGYSTYTNTRVNNTIVTNNEVLEMKDKDLWLNGKKLEPGTQEYLAAEKRINDWSIEFEREMKEFSDSMKNMFK